MSSRSIKLHWVILMLVVSSWLASCSTLPTAPVLGVVLSPTEAEAVLHQCSRWAPTEVAGYWTPEPAVVQDLEKRLPRVAKKKAKKCCLVGASIKDPTSYYRQYAGIEWEGRKLIYVNAMSTAEPAWKSDAVVLCEGGTTSWGVLYDPKTGKFTALAVNGIA